MGSRTVPQPADLWERYVMAIEDVTDRLERITRALEQASVPYALVGGQAVALWVASRDPAAVRTTKDVDLLLRHEDLPNAQRDPWGWSISRSWASECSSSRKTRTLVTAFT